MIKISVIVPVYNAEKYLKKCLDSVLNQTLKDIEVICIDDGSSDSSFEILKKYSYNDDRVVIISQDNSGPAKTRNKGIELATGEYLTFVDSDDWIELDALEKLYDNAILNNSEVVLFNAIEHRINNKFHKRIYLPIDDNIDYSNFVFDYNYRRNLVMNYFLVVWSKLYKTSFLRNNNLYFDGNFKMFEDVPFHIETMMYAKRISYLPEILYNYNKLNMQSEQTKKTNFNNRLAIFDIFDYVENFLIKNKFFEEFKYNFFKFKIVESEVNLSKTSDEFKEDFYNNIRKHFLQMDVPFNLLEKLPIENSRFYTMVILHKDYYKFKEFMDLVKNIGLRGIYKPKLNDEIKNFKECGINLNTREESIIVSLTSFPERMQDIHYCLYSLLNQEFKPDKVILWLADSQFPNRENDIPDDVLNLKKNGLSIEWCDDLRSYKKIIPALKQYPDSYIVTADDDIFYPKDWLKTMWSEYKNYPNTIISSRTRRITFDLNNNILEYSKWTFPTDKLSSYINFPTGAGGTMFFPNSLSQKIFDENLFLRLCPSGDDIWIWAMAVLNETKITSIGNPMKDLNYVNLARELGINDDFTLWQLNQAGENEKKKKNVLDEFPRIKEIINVE